MGFFSSLEKFNKKLEKVATTVEGAAKVVTAVDNLCSGQTIEVEEKNEREKDAVSSTSRGVEIKAPKLYGKDGTEIRPFTPRDFNNNRPKR